MLLLQKRLTTAAKKAVSKMPQKTVRRGDAVSYCAILVHFQPTVMLMVQGCVCHLSACLFSVFFLYWMYCGQMVHFTKIYFVWSLQTLLHKAAF